jgi:radical SAM superfamily enzyme YgiQ (UPF0313 family)
MEQTKHPVWLCDLTHTFQTLATNRIPLGIGMIASYCRKQLGELISIHLFKFLDTLIEALKREPDPLIVGFANYVWNQNLNMEVAKRIKKRIPDSVIVFGGPNFPSEDNRQTKFLKTAPWIDFYLLHEGEVAFADLIRLVLEHDGDAEVVKRHAPLNSVFLQNGKLAKGEPGPRIDISEVPSPYLSGILTDFFGQLKPLVQMTRGCPFSCTYCTEGLDNWNKISRQMPQTIEKELEYIADRCNPAEDLFIADSNFGMYPQDLEHCKIIARIQDKYTWPGYIHVATGKNKKERVLSASKLIRGALRLSASVQSTDSVVLRNVKRHNISLQKILSLGKAAGETGANTYSELILALPGDSLEAHLQSLKDVLDADLNTIRPFTLMLLLGTEVAAEKSMEEFQMLPKFRVIPRCFGKYLWIDNDVILTAEIEKVCVGNSTLSFEDYTECRRFHLTIEIFYNDGILGDLYEVLKTFGITVYEFLRSIHATATGSDLKKLYNDFIRETHEELWNSPEEIQEFIQKPEVIEKYQRGEYGANLLFKYKTLAFTEQIPTILDIAFEQAAEMIRQSDNSKLEESTWIFDFLEDLKRFYYNRTADFLETEKVFEETFDFDVVGFSNKTIPLMRVAELRQRIRFAHTKEQADTIELNKRLFGDDLIGISRLLSQIFIKKCFRTPEILERMVRIPEKRSQR